MSRARFLFAAAFVSAALVAAEPASVTTRDGFALRFAADGRIAQLRLDGNAVALTAEPSLLRVRDAATKSPFAPVKSEAAARGNGIVLTSRNPSLGLAVTATITARGDYLDIVGDVSTESAADR